MNNYLIPANTKRGKLILGLFRPVDLIIFGCGIFATIILLLFIPTDTTTGVVIVVSPALFATLLVAPVPYYHNVINVLIELWAFLTSRQQFIWKGWCAQENDEDK